MTLRTKQITLAGIVLMVAFVLGLLAMSLASLANHNPPGPATLASTQTARMPDSKTRFISSRMTASLSPCCQMKGNR